MTQSLELPPRTISIDHEVRFISANAVRDWGTDAVTVWVVADILCGPGPPYTPVHADLRRVTSSGQDERLYGVSLQHLDSALLF